MKKIRNIFICLLALSLFITGCANNKKDSKNSTNTTKVESTKEDSKDTDKEKNSEKNDSKESKNQQDDKKINLKDGTYEAEGNGFGGKIKLSVTVANGKIDKIDVIEQKETEPVFSRALPVITERIIAEQSPIVDNVSAATMSSFGVKKAVASALKEAGHDFGEINMSTEKERGEKSKKEDENTQVLIVGGGPSGLSAAIEAKTNGAKDVMLIEKLDILSGNGKFDMNFFDMINSKAMKDNGVSVSKEEFIASKEKAVDSKERKEVWAQGSSELDAWLRDLGAELNYNYCGEKGTCHMAEENEYAGDHIQQNLEKKAKELGIVIKTGTKGIDLIMDGNKVKGVKVEDRDNFYNINSDAVIISTGGFSYNKDLLKEYAPGAEKVNTSNQIGAQGDFIEIFKKHNLKMDHMDVLSVFPMIIKHRRDLTGAGDGYMLVNKDGNRFAPEDSGGLEMAHKILDQEHVFYIYDQPLYESFYRLKKHNDLGYHVKADTLEELAEKLGINPENLKTTFKKYNDAVEGKAKDEFRETMPENKLAEKGPYYGVEIESAIHMTKGGVVANEKAQVLNNNDEIIEGLYASGEVTDTSGAYSASVIFGRVAGQEAAKFVSE